MSQQRQFWPPINSAPCHPLVWKQLTENERASVRRRLAQLIRKAVQANRSPQTQEDPHDG